MTITNAIETQTTAATAMASSDEHHNHNHPHHYQLTNNHPSTIPIAAAVAASMFQQQHNNNFIGNGGHFPISSPSTHSQQLPLSNDDIKKTGYMRKQKTNKRKFFVLRLNSCQTFHKATLSYYDNEKKFRDKQPRRTILLTECFAVARIPDHKKFVLGIYTKEDLLATVCDDEKQLIEWLQAIRFILYRMPEYHARPFRDFHYIWQGNITRVGDGMSRSLMGTYRFCLLQSVLYLIKVDPNVDNPKYYEFPLSIIHRCGHKDRTFYLKIGRLSEIGAGEFWILTDDNIIAEHMHAKVSSFWAINNKSGGKLENSDCGTGAGEDISQYSSSSTSTIRPRSSSTSTADQILNLSCSNNVIPRNNSNNNNRSVQSSQQNNQYYTIGANFQYYPPLTTTNTNTKEQDNSESPKNQQQPIVPKNMSNFHTSFYNIPSYCAGNNNISCGGGGTISSSSQSPTHSRERLHSGTWSRTASDCSNEDISNASSATHNIGGAMNWDPATMAAAIAAAAAASAANNHHLNHNNPLTIHNCTSPLNNNFYPNSFVHGDMSTNNNNKSNSSNSSLSTEFDNEQQQMMFLDQFYSLFGGISNGCGHSMLEHHHNPVSSQSSNNSNMISIEEKGYGADLDLYSSTALSQQPTICSNCLQQYSLCYLQMMNLQGQQHRSSSHSTAYNNSVSSHNQSPVTSPKCHCAACLHFGGTPIIPGYPITAATTASPCCNNNHNHHYLPTIPAGEPADYVPMKPGNGASANKDKNDETSPAVDDDSTKSKVNDNDQEGESYLLMAPLSPTKKQTNNDDLTATPTSMANSIEFNLEKVKSYISSEEEPTTNPPAIAPTLTSSNEESNNKPAAKTKGIPPPSSSSNANNLDDDIFNGLTRAYSTGSKPQPLAPSIGSQLTNNNTVSLPVQTSSQSKPLSSETKQQSIKTASHMRIRASSTGSHGMKFRAFLYSRRNKNKSNPPIGPIPVMNCSSAKNNMDPNCCESSNVSSMGSSCSLLPHDNSNQNGQQQQKANKAASAPILSSLIQPRARSHTLGSKPSNFMHHMFSSNNNEQKLKPTTSNNNIATAAATNPILFSMAPGLIPDVLTNMYGIPSQISPLVCCPHHHGICTAQQLAHPHPPICTTSCSSSQQQPPIAPQLSKPEEGDLMEIDYSAKNKERSQQKQQQQNAPKEEPTEEETSLTSTNLKESKKKDIHSQDKSKNENEDHHHSANNNSNQSSKRIDNSSSSASSSMLSGLFHGPKSNNNSNNTKNQNQNNSNSNKSSLSNPHHHNPLDSLVTAVKHLSFPHHHGGSKNLKQQETSSSNLTKNVAPDENNYMMLTPGTKSSNNNLLTKSLPNKDNDNDQSEEPIYSMMDFSGRKTTNTAMETSFAPLAMNESDEESSYVLMTPENVSSNSNKSNTKKQKSSTMKSLLSTLSSSNNSGGSSSSSSSTTTTASIFRINRINSFTKNHHRRKNSSNSLSEDSTTTTMIPNNNNNNNNKTMAT